MAEKQKLQIASYWGAACGGCDVALLDTDEFILEVAASCDIRFWPIAVDGKYADVERMSDGELDLTLFHGAVRNSENEHIAKLLRKKSKLLAAFGSCACMGGIPGLANLTTKEAIFSRAYLNNPSLESGSNALPQPVTSVEGGELHLPKFYRRVYRLQDIVEVDYFVPGCPPAPAQIQCILRAVLAGALPARGSVVGAAERALCDECPRVKGEKKVRQFHRPHEIRQDPYRCLLEQGILCMGSVTRGGCGVRCPNTGVGCRGCYGPPPGVVDQGAKFLSAVASIVDSNDPQEIEAIMATVYDVVGSAYRFGMPGSLLQRSLRE